MSARPRRAAGTVHRTVSNGHGRFRRSARRFLFYCNEMVGLGHLRRTLTIVDALTRAHRDVTALIITGSPAEPVFRVPERTDTLKLPVRTRDAEGNPRSRLVLDTEELRRLRAHLALAAALAFAPDVAVVDKLPLGLDRELEPTLTALAAGGRCRLALGLRDIEDSAAHVHRKWGDGMRDAIRQLYDAILVYGPGWTPDAIDCMGWDPFEVPIWHVGYVGSPVPEARADADGDGYLLATSGAGYDGYELLAALARTIRDDPLPCDTVMVAGPLRDPRELARLRDLVAGLRIRLYDYRTDLPQLIAGARAVVSMAGYNTVGEIMRTRRPALLVPRVRPSEEQLIRARLVERRAGQQVIHPDELEPGRLRHELDRLLERPAVDFDPDEYDGAANAVDLLSAMAGLEPPGYAGNGHGTSTVTLPGPLRVAAR